MVGAVQLGVQPLGDLVAVGERGRDAHYLAAAARQLSSGIIHGLRASQFERDSQCSIQATGSLQCPSLFQGSAKALEARNMQLQLLCRGAVFEEVPGARLGKAAAAV